MAQPSAQACPTKACRQRQGGGVIVRKKLCIQCGECVGACPVDGVAVNERGEVFVCIHCGRCVAYCPQDCLEMREVGDIEEVLL